MIKQRNKKNPFILAIVLINANVKKPCCEVYAYNYNQFDTLKIRGHFLLA